MTERRIEISGHLRNLKPFIIAFALTLAPCLYFYYTDQDIVILYIGLGFGALYAIPALIVHANYYNHDKGKRVFIDLAAKSIKIEKKHIRQTIDFFDIESIILTRGVSGSRTILHKYFYFQFKLKNNEVIYLTSLLLQENDISFKNKTSRTVAFPTIKYVESKESKAESVPDQKQIEKFKLTYQTKKNDELEAITTDGRFIMEAKIAATQLLEDRLKMHNS